MNTARAEDEEIGVVHDRGEERDDDGGEHAERRGVRDQERSVIRVERRAGDEQLLAQPDAWWCVDAAEMAPGC